MNKEIIELIRDYLDERIDAQGLARLNHILETNEKARAEFRAMATMEEGLRDLAVTTEFPLLSSEDSESARNQEPTTRRWFSPLPLSIAALFIAFLGIAYLLSPLSQSGDDWGDAVARIQFLSEDAKFETNQQLPTRRGELLGKGWVHLKEGQVDFVFRSGATLKATGPALIGLDTQMRAYLDYGTVEVYTPETARDFVVATESVEVVDLGTRFEITMDKESREADVAVVEGLVDLHLGSRGANRTIRPLEAGYAAHVDAFGRIIKISEDGPQSRPQREESPELMGHWTFDEVASNGLLKDESGRSLDGYFRTAKAPELVPGKSDNALKFSDGEFVDLSEHISLLGKLEDFTVAAWVKDPVAPLSLIFSISGESEQQRVQFYLAKSFARFGWQQGPHFDSLSGRVDGWEEGRWYHIALSLEGKVARLYRDGEAIASGSLGASLGTSIASPSSVKGASHAYIGRLTDGRQGPETMTQGLRGILDDVQLYEGALSAEGLRFLFENPGRSWSPKVLKD